MAELEEHGLRLPQYAVLTALSDFGALAPHELALRLGADRSHISNYVEGLVRLGWVRRDPDPDDRRRHTVALTPAGRAPLTALQRAATGSQQILLRDLSPDEQQTLVTLLLKVITTADSSPTTRNG